jgi:catechol 2,3-dioxygenase-like lactoylglutathione lyase family enzyme
MSDETVNVRYMVDDVASAVDFYAKHLGFTEQVDSPAFDVRCGHLRLRLSGQLRRPTDARRSPTGPRWVEKDPSHHMRPRERDRSAARRRCPLRNDVVTGTGGSQVLIEDPSGNLIELFQPAGVTAINSLTMTTEERYPTNSGRSVRWPRCCPASRT